MNECLAGRQLTAAFIGEWPEFAEPCEREATEFLCVGMGDGSSQVHSICTHHREILQNGKVLGSEPMGWAQ